MKKVTRNVLIAGAAATLLAGSASAQLMVQGVGSSALFQSLSLAAFEAAGAGAGHYTASNAGKIIDTREAGFVAENGTLSVVWSATRTQAWTYLSVDSVAGNRAYFAQPRAILQLSSPLPAADQRISAALWGADAATIPPAVQALINNQAFNAAFTDILPADAKFATNRVLCGTPTTAGISCLGYATDDPNVGTAIQSAFSSSVVHPVNFNIFGNDPITNKPIPEYTVVPIGISPIIFIANRTNAAGLGQAGLFNDVTYQATAWLLFTGTDCAGTAFGGFTPNYYFAINPILREPLSGTMNTFEFTVMLANGGGPTGYYSQEGILNSPYIPTVTYFGAIPPATNNPLNGACPGGSPWAVGPQGARKRAIGTGEMVSAVKSSADAIGYIFFGYGNVSPIAGSPSYGYLTYQTVDPINPSGNYATPFVSGGLNFPGNGQLPVCTAPCPIAPGASFPNIRNGAYRPWSLLRAIADTGSTALTNVQALATIAQDEINHQVPEFVPFNPAGGDPGFIGYRSHFAPGMIGTPASNFNATNTPDNGLGTAPEAGGDVGGCLEYKVPPPGVLNSRC
jgi:hypothetical protein